MATIVVLFDAALEQLAHLDNQRLACTKETLIAIFGEEAIANHQDDTVPFAEFVENFVVQNHHETYVSERERDLLAADEWLLSPIDDNGDDENAPKERGHDAVMAAAKAVRTASCKFVIFVFIDHFSFSNWMVFLHLFCCCCFVNSFSIWMVFLHVFRCCCFVKLCGEKVTRILQIQIHLMRSNRNFRMLDYLIA